MPADDSSTVEAEIEPTLASIKRMVAVGALFAAVGYLLILGALFLELTQFHPLLEDFFSSYTQHSLAGGGPDRAGSAALNTALASIHKFPSTLLWLMLGGIGHVLVGIFIVIAGIVRALSLVPKRLARELGAPASSWSALSGRAPRPAPPSSQSGG